MTEFEYIPAGANRDVSEHELLRHTKIVTFPFLLVISFASRSDLSSVVLVMITFVFCCLAFFGTCIVCQDIHVVGCGGFIKSNVDIDFALIEVRLCGLAVDF